MAKDVSVAPKERINIRYNPATGDAQAEAELPLRVLVVGDFSDGESNLPLEERKKIELDKNNFEKVMQAAEVRAEFVVEDVLSGEEGHELPISLSFDSIRDFEPDSIVRQVPVLSKLIELREALVALKGPLGNIPAFRRRLQELLEDEGNRALLISELQQNRRPEGLK